MSDLGDFQPPKLEPIPLDPNVAALLEKIIDTNRLIAEGLCSPVRFVNLNPSRSES